MKRGVSPTSNSSISPASSRSAGGSAAADLHRPLDRPRIHRREVRLRRTTSSIHAESHLPAGVICLPLAEALVSHGDLVAAAFHETGNPARFRQIRRAARGLRFQRPVHPHRRQRGNRRHHRSPSLDLRRQHRHLPAHAGRHRNQLESPRDRHLPLRGRHQPRPRHRLQRPLRRAGLASSTTSPSRRSTKSRASSRSTRPRPPATPSAKGFILNTGASWARNESPVPPRRRGLALGHALGLHPRPRAGIRPAHLPAPRFRRRLLGSALQELALR